MSDSTNAVFLFHASFLHAEPTEGKLEAMTRSGFSQEVTEPFRQAQGPEPVEGKTEGHFPSLLPLFPPVRCMV
jgi:hypothetical protein